MKVKKVTDFYGNCVAVTINIFLTNIIFPYIITRNYKIQYNKYSQKTIAAKEIKFIFAFIVFKNANGE